MSPLEVALFNAIKSGNVAQVEQAINDKVNVNVRNAQLFTPLHTAVFFLERDIDGQKRYKNIINKLLNASADAILLVDNIGFNVMQQVIYRGSYLYDNNEVRKSDLYFDLASELLKKLHGHSNFMQSFNQLLTTRRGKLVNVPHTLLQMAVYFSWTRMVDTLLEYRPDVRLVNGAGLTALHLAVLMCVYTKKPERIDIVKNLLVHQAHLVPQLISQPWTGTWYAEVDKWMWTLKIQGIGDTALHTAVKYKQEALVTLLLSFKADTSVLNAVRKTAEQIARDAKDTKIVGCFDQDKINRALQLAVKDDVPPYFSLSSSSEPKIVDPTPPISPTPALISGPVSGPLVNLPPPFVSPINQHWYTDDEMNQLLQHYLSGNQQIELLDGMSGTDWHGETLKSNLLEFNKQRLIKISQGESIKDKVFIPVNLNNSHWALLYIIYPRDASQPPSIYYFDPLGNKIPKMLENVLQDELLFLGAEITNIGKRVQQDSYNCGPWVIEAAREIAANGSVPEATHNIAQAREEHKNILAMPAKQPVLPPIKPEPIPAPEPAPIPPAPPLPPPPLPKPVSYPTQTIKEFSTQQIPVGGQGRKALLSDITQFNPDSLKKTETGKKVEKGIGASVSALEALQREIAKRREVIEGMQGEKQQESNSDFDDDLNSIDKTPLPTKSV